jgi:uncharacterized protein (TIGR00730 family)
MAVQCECAVTRIPQPPNPKNRSIPLPDEIPRTTSEQSGVAQQIAILQKESSYLEATRDPSFLGRRETRGVRLQLDYQKTESILASRGIEATIVVFGSTRLCEPDRAREKLRALESHPASLPEKAEHHQQRAVAERLLAKSHFYEVARAFAREVARCPQNRNPTRIWIMTGGGPGIMEAANRGACESQAESIGLNIRLPHEQYPNPYITPGLCFRFHYFATRKLHFLLRAKALVAFPGGYGTLDELFETLTLIQTRVMAPVPVVLVGESYWRRAINLDFLVEEGVIDPEDRDLFWYAESADEIWSGIQAWHEANKTPLFPE